MSAVTPGRAARDLRAEEAKSEFDGWFAAQGNDPGDDYAEYGSGDMAESFAAGMQAERDLTAVTGDGTLRTRITHLAATWEGNGKLTEEGALLRDLGQILRDELHHASDPEPKPVPELAVTASRLGYALAALREIAEPSDEAAHDIARNALDDDKAIREGSADKAAPGLAEPVTVAGVLYADYPSLVAAMQAEIDRERTERLHLAAGRDEARSDYSRLRSVLLDDSRPDASARRRCLAIIATAGTPPVGMPLDVQRKHRPGDCQCTPCRTAAPEAAVSVDIGSPEDGERDDCEPTL